MKTYDRVLLEIGKAKQRGQEQIAQEQKASRECVLAVQKIIEQVTREVKATW